MQGGVLLPTTVGGFGRESAKTGLLATEAGAEGTNVERRICVFVGKFELLPTISAEVKACNEIMRNAVGRKPALAARGGFVLVMTQQNPFDERLERCQEANCG